MSLNRSNVAVLMLSQFTNLEQYHCLVGWSIADSVLIL